MAAADSERRWMVASRQYLPLLPLLLVLVVVVVVPSLLLPISALLPPPFLTPLLSLELELLPLLS